ncbi:TPA: hypothetical protein ACUNCG_000437 [Aeromonas hydrophila]
MIAPIIKKYGNNYLITNTLTSGDYCHINLTFHTDADEPEIEIHKIIINTKTQFINTDNEDDIGAEQINFYENTLNYLIEQIEQ